MADIGYVNGYKSITTSKKNNLSHLFFNLNHDLNLENYISSDLKFSFNKITKDNYLKIFDQHLTKSTLRPKNSDKLDNNFKIFLEHQDFSLSTGFQSYESLQTKKSSDRYQYNLPYYNFDKLISQVKK